MTHSTLIRKICLSAMLLFANFLLKAQQIQQLNNQDGLFASVELTRIDSSKSKETYLAIAKLENKNNFEVFYGVPMTKNASGQYEIGLLQNISVAQITVRNSTSFFGDYLNFVGKETNLVTIDNQKLYSIPKGVFLTVEKEFKVKAGNKPILTNTFLMNTKPTEAFEIALNEKQLNGDWKNSCGNITFMLTYTSGSNNQFVLKQRVNGKEISWKKTAAYVFEKVGDSNTKLVFSSAKQTFTYVSADGIECTWTKN